MYTQLEICGIFLQCDTATELMDVRELLEETGHYIGSVAFEVYNNSMNLLLITEKI